MLYLNQLNYRHIHYEHNVENGGVPQERQCIATSGCGLCSACMMVEHLTNHELSLDECIRMTYESGANKKIGSCLELLGPALAEKFHLEYKNSNEIEDVLQCLRVGGRVIINVGGDHDGYVGLYSHGGHYVIAIAYDGKELCILDPSYKEGKYEIEARKGKVRVDYPFTYCKPEYIVEDTQNKPIRYHLFTRK